jgi:single-strand DNA-binding protein
MYLNEAQISLTGYVATQPLVRTTPSGALNVSMRVAWTPRRQDRVTGEWVDGNTSYVTVICWRKLASNAGVCVRKGDPVLVKGRLSIREFEDKQGMRRTAVEVEASSVGHDLSRGVAQFQRVRPQTGMTAAEYAAAQGQSPAGPGIPEGENGSASVIGLAMSNGSAGSNGSTGANGSGSAQGLAVGREAMLELTENGFSASPDSMDEADEVEGTKGERREPMVSDEDVDRFLGEAAEVEKSPDLEPAGAPF